MSWVTVAVVGGGAVLGQQQAKRQRDMQYQQNMAEAAQTQYSPWTGMGAGKIGTQSSSDIAAALQGGMAGAQVANSFGAFKAKPPPANGVDAPLDASAKGTPSSLNMYDPRLRNPYMIG